MDLQNNLCTKTGWDIVETAFQPEQLVTTGSNFMIGNGYLGYRGTFAEWEADRYVACIVSDTYDMADGERRELCNVPNGLFTQLFVDGEIVSAFQGTSLNFERSLDLRYGRYARSQAWQGNKGQRIKLEVEKFASYHNLHLIVMRYSFRPDQDAAVRLVTGIDGRVWNLSGEHFKRYASFKQGDLIAMETVTAEFDIEIDVVEGLTVQGASPTADRVTKPPKRVLREMTFRLSAGEEVTIEKVVALYTSNDIPNPREQATADAQDALQAGRTMLWKDHQSRWDEIWARSDIQIDGDLEAQTITRFNIYQNIIATPAHARLPIGARGLSCQVYQGAAFWDQEIFNLPMLLFTHPDMARGILRYRHDTLDGARTKAQRLGYEGAFYAWTSGKTGEELFPDYFFENVLTGRRIRNHFNDWQIHISPDIVYAIWQYYVATGDWDFVVDYGAEIAFEVARFLFSHVYFKKDKIRYEFIRLLGPDEYHENVDNNAFTNYQAHFALDKAVTFYERMREDAPDELEVLLRRLDLSEEDIEAWRDMIRLLYLPQPDPDTRLLEQFDGYFDLEDIRPDELRKRLIHPEEYWGWPNGIAVETQVLKQADVLQLFALQDTFPVEVMRANYDYYEPRTEHGSSLSPSVHAVVASKVGYAEEAYDYFVNAATIDLYNASTKVMSGGTFLGGIHTAACGAIWQMVVEGFAGFSIDEDGIRFAPALPARWDGLWFNLVVRGSLLTARLVRGEMTIRSAAENEAPVTVSVGERTMTLHPGESGTVPSEP
jgi:kojibiose phosphorylase